MLDISTVKAGQRVTVLYDAPVEWGRTVGNPFVDLEVTRAMKVCFTAAGEETYTRQADSKGHELSGKQAWHTPAPEVGPCVRKHRTKGTLYLAGINHDTATVAFYIGGELATPAQTEAIRSFMPAPRERERGLDFRVWTLEKLQNAVLTEVVNETVS